MYRAVNIWFRRYLMYCLCALGLLSPTYFLFPINYKSDLILTEQQENRTEVPLTMFWPKVQNNLSCYYSVEGDALVSTEDPSFSPGEKAIFFHETSCRGGVNSRQACSIESAARLHPNWQINLLFSAPVNKSVLEKSTLTKLLELPNVKFARIHIAEYGKGTAVDSILSNRLNESAHPIEHAADMLRMVTMHRFGGVYLDTDTILMRNLDSLSLNWIAKESGTDIASGIMRFTKNKVGSLVTDKILREIHDTYSPKSWAGNGPKAIQRALDKLCPNVLKTIKGTGICADVQIFPPESFYPIHYNKHKSYFKNGTVDLEGPYMHHMWNYLSKNLKIEHDSPYERIAKKYCPLMYNLYGNQFGD